MGDIEILDKLTDTICYSEYGTVKKIKALNNTSIRLTLKENSSYP